MTLNNNLPDSEMQEPINSSQLSYADKAKKGESVSMATDSTSDKEYQCVCNENSTLKRAPKLHSKSKEKTVDGANVEPSENMYNMQLLYDIN